MRRRSTAQVLILMATLGIHGCGAVDPHVELRTQFENEAAEFSEQVGAMAGRIFVSRDDNPGRDPASEGSYARRGAITIDPRVLQQLRTGPLDLLASMESRLVEAQVRLGETRAELLRSIRGTTTAGEQRFEFREFLPDTADFGFPLQFDLFDDTQIAVRLTSFLPTDDGEGTVWTGAFADAEGEVVMSLRDEILSATLRTADGTVFEIQPDQVGGHVVVETRAAQSPRDLEPLIPEEQPVGLEFDREGPGDDGSTLDVLVAISPAAQAEMNGAIGALGKIDVAVSDANRALAESGVAMQVRLRGVVRVDGFDDSPRQRETAGDYFRRLIKNLRNNTDGVFTSVHDARADNCVDAVSLWIRDAFDDAGGLAYRPILSGQVSGFADNAFSVVSHRWARANFSFAHELAHNLGAHHDRASVSNPANALFPFAFGFRDPARGVRTLMAPGCVPGEECEVRLRLLSNPVVMIKGGPMGVSEGNPGAARNQLALENTRQQATNWRRSC